MTAAASRGKSAAADQTAEPTLHNDRSGVADDRANNQTAAQIGGDVRRMGMSADHEV
jgi:hypothetical protein